MNDNNNVILANIHNNTSANEEGKIMTNINAVSNKHYTVDSFVVTNDTPESLGFYADIKLSDRFSWFGGQVQSHIFRAPIANDAGCEQCVLSLVYDGHVIMTYVPDEVGASEIDGYDSLDGFGVSTDDAFIDACRRVDSLAEVVRTMDALEAAYYDSHDPDADVVAFGSLNKFEYSEAATNAFIQDLYNFIDNNQVNTEDLRVGCKIAIINDALVAAGSSPDYVKSCSLHDRYMLEQRYIVGKPEFVAALDGEHTSSIEDITRGISVSAGCIDTHAIYRLYTACFRCKDLISRFQRLSA